MEVNKELIKKSEGRNERKTITISGSRFIKICFKEQQDHSGGACEAKTEYSISRGQKEEEKEDDNEEEKMYKVVQI